MPVKTKAQELQEKAKLSVLPKPEVDTTAMLEEPAAAPTPTEAPVRLEWPEATEVRELDTDLDDDQIIERGRLLVDHLRKADALATEKKSCSDRYKALIEDEEKIIGDLSIVVKSGKDRVKIPCRWQFQTNGFDADGKGIYHSELKTLFREDTMAVVEIKPITSEDRQINLPLGEEESLEADQQAIEDAGYTLEETRNDSDLSEPFALTAPDGTEKGIEADSVAEATRKARALLPTKPTEAEAEAEADNS